MILKKFGLALAAFLMLVGVSTTANAQRRGGGYWSGGQITRKEQRKLYRQRQKIYRAEARAYRDGRLNRGERRRIENRYRQYNRTYNRVTTNRNRGRGDVYYRSTRRPMRRW